MSPRLSSLARRTSILRIESQILTLSILKEAEESKEQDREKTNESEEGSDSTSDEDDAAFFEKQTTDNTAGINSQKGFRKSMSLSDIETKRVSQIERFERKK